MVRSAFVCVVHIIVEGMPCVLLSALVCICSPDIIRDSEI
jgi:hypothetical protein